MKKQIYTTRIFHSSSVSQTLLRYPLWPTCINEISLRMLLSDWLIIRIMYYYILLEGPNGGTQVSVNILESQLTIKFIVQNLG